MSEPRWIKIGSYVVLVIAAIIAVVPGHLGLRHAASRSESEIFSTSVEFVGRAASRSRTTRPC